MTATTREGLDRKAAWIVTAAAAVALLVVAAVLVPWQWVPGGSLTPARAADAFTAAQLHRAESYSHAVRLLSWSSYGLTLVLAVAVGLSRAGSWLADRVGLGPWWVRTSITTLVLLVLGRLVTLPFSVAIRRRNLDVGLTRQPFSGWLSDVALSLLVSWVTTSILVLVVVGLARRSPRRWFGWAAATAVLLTFAGSLVYPVVVEPLFNQFTPMADGPFKQSVLRLAAEEGVHVDDVLVADASRRTTTLNAYVSGIGSTRRVVVYDNLLKDLSPAEARSVIAHELGHAKHHDVLLGTGLGALGAVVGVSLLALLLDSRRLRRRAGVDGPGDPRCVALVLALVSVGMFLVSPAQNTVSRAIEARADRTALETTHDDAAFRSMQRQLALRSLADPTPPRWSQFWFGTHPTSLQRLGLPASLHRAGR